MRQMITSEQFYELSLIGHNKLLAYWLKKGYPLQCSSKELVYGGHNPPCEWCSPTLLPSVGQLICFLDDLGEKCVIAKKNDLWGIWNESKFKMNKETEYAGPELVEVLWRLIKHKLGE